MKNVIDELNTIAILLDLHPPRAVVSMLVGCDYDPKLHSPYDKGAKNVWPDGCLTVNTKNGNCRMRLKMNASATSVRVRAKKLATAVADCRTKSAKDITRQCKPLSFANPRRPNKQVAERFSRDGEVDNYNNYMGLFE